MKKIAILIFLLLPSILLMAQDRIIKGVVTDENGIPSPGVSVMVKGTNQGTVTNINGEYSLKVSSSTAVVSFSYIGYVTTEIKIADKTSVNVKLQPNTIVLDEAVVVAYGTQKKPTVTGSVSSISPKELLKSPTANMAAALIGRTPGLTTYQSSGQPGADGITMRIRGIETSNGSSPLILVDGVERDFTQLDPNEIESISVLKDAATTAVFGVRGANGVMIVTTKKGEAGPAKVSVTSNFSIQQPTRMPKMIGAESFLRMYNEAQVNDVATATPRFSEDDIVKYVSKSNQLEYPNVEWFDKILKPSALQQQHNVNISGGTKSTRYYTSIGYFTQDGLMRDYAKVLDRSLDNNYKYDRINLRSNIDIDVTPTTAVGVMISGVVSKTNDPGFNWTNLIASTPISYPIIYEDKIVTSTINFAPSPLMSAIGQTLSEKHANSIALTLNLKQKLDFLLKGLSARVMMSYDSYYKNTISQTEGYMTYRVDYLPDATGETVRQLQPSGEKTLASSRANSLEGNRKIHAEGALEYKKGFSGHNFGGLLLFNLDKKWYSTDASKDVYYYIPVQYNGIVGRFTYDYKSKYMVEFNMGYNGSESFPSYNRFAWFPAVSAGWNVSEENFFKAVMPENILDKLKIRVSHGLVGNDGTQDSRFLYIGGNYISNGGAMFGDVSQTSKPGYREDKTGNASSTWETATKQNLGVEFAMFKNQLSFTADIFRSHRTGILRSAQRIPVHVVMKGPSDYYNIGEVKNRGYELELKWRQDFKDFSYYINGNYSFARNKWLETGEVLDPNNPQIWQVGRRIGENYGLIADGFFANADEVAQGPVYGNPGVGNVRYVDVNGDGKITAEDRTPIGHPTFPEVNYGFNFGFSYKGFDFSVLFQGATNTTKFMSGKFQKPFDANGGVMDFVVAERWTPENAANAIRPKLTLNYINVNDYAASSIWMRDGSYLRLRNIELAYRIKQSIIKKYIGVNGLRIFVNGQNLYTWDKLKVIDPEGDLADSWKYPQLKVYNVGLKIDF